MITNHIKRAFRSLLRNKVYSGINIGGLALGMATAVLLLLWVQNEGRFDSYHQKAEGIYRLKTHLKISEKDTWHWATTPFQLGNYLKETAPEVQAVTRLFPPIGVDVSLKADGHLFSEKNLVFVDKNWFDVFDYTFIKGNAHDFASDKNNIALTESQAKKYFGDSNPIDKIIQYDSLNLLVKAVLKDVPPNSSFKYTVLAQNEARLANPKILEDDMNWGNFSYETYLLCYKNGNTSATADKFSKLLRHHRQDTTNNTVLELQPIADMHFDTSIQAANLESLGNKNVMTIFSIIALFILLIACINYINLTTARVSLRTKEVSVKKIIGASRNRLFQQFFVESTLTSVLAALLALGLISLGLPLLENITDTRFSFSENSIIWAILGAVTMASILLTGIYPALLLSSFQPIKILRGGNVGGTKNATFRKGLVVFQFTFTIVLLIATLLIFKQLRFIQTKELGYDKEHVFTMTIPWFVKNQAILRDRLAQELKRESSILDVTMSNSEIVDVKNTHSGSLNWTGKDPNWRPSVTQLSIHHNYPDFFKLKLADGRWFQENNKTDDNNVILNETAIKEYNISKPVIGQYFELHGRKGQIVGVVKDFHFRSPRVKITPLVMFTNSGWAGTISVKTAPNQLQKAIASTERTWKELVPNMAFKYTFLEETYDKMHRTEQRQLSLFNAFAGVVLLISCFGLFGLATFAAETRIKEIGIRKVLGASVVGITALLSKDFLKLVLIAFVIASPVAWFLAHKWLENYAYRIPIDGWIFALIGVLIIGIALLTVSFQAIKAAVANPVKSLRTE